MAAMGLLTGPLGRVLGFVATRYITAPEVGVVAMLRTVLAPFLAFIIFAEVAPMTSFVGGAVILTAILAYMLNLGPYGTKQGLKRGCVPPDASMHADRPSPGFERQGGIRIRSSGPAQNLNVDTA